MNSSLFSPLSSTIVSSPKVDDSDTDCLLDDMEVNMHSNNSFPTGVYLKDLEVPIEAKEQALELRELGIEICSDVEENINALKFETIYRGALVFFEDRLEGRFIVMAGKRDEPSLVDFWGKWKNHDPSTLSCQLITV